MENLNLAMETYKKDNKDSEEFNERQPLSKVIKPKSDV